MYFILTSYTLIMFLKVLNLNHFIMKVKNFVKYFKEVVLKYFKNFRESEIFHRASLTVPSALWFSLSS